MDPVYLKPAEVPLHEIDHHGKIRLSGIFNFLQNASSEQSAFLGYPITALLKRRLTWVVSRYHLLVHRYPAWGEKLTVSTWRSGQMGLFALREYEIASEGETLVSATGSFALLDLSRGKKVSPSEYFPDYPILEKRMLEDDFGKFPGPGETPHRKTFEVRKHDLDLNRHVNNTLYLQWGLESVPDEIFSNLSPVEVEIAFRGQAVFGDSLVSGCEAGAEDDTFLHRIERTGDGRECAGLRTRWAGKE